MFKVVLKYIALALIVALAVAYILPGNVKVKRATMIDARPGEVFALVNSFENFNRWSPWYERDPEGDYRLEGPEQGVGARMIWASDKPDVGSGSQEIIESVPDRLVRTRLDFGDMGDANAFFRLEPRGEGKTHLVWGFDTDLGLNPVSRYVGLMFDRWIGSDYELGLAKLKTLAEQQSQTATN
ncbi:MAG: SRPBCC family protein [Alphaproteobacteria bacterium]